MHLMSVTLEVSKWDKSREVRAKQLSNILRILRTLEVSKCDKSIEVRAEQ